MSDITPLINFLHEEYYKNDNTPDSLVSSHWKMMHEKTKIDFDNNNITLTGSGFAYESSISIPGKILTWLSICCYLLRFKNRKQLVSLIRSSLKLTKKMNVPFTYDCFRQICTFDLINRYTLANKIIIIGDGFGFLSVFIKERWPDSKIFLIDLGKTLMFQVYHCFKAHPEKNHQLSIITDSKGINHQAGKADFIYCPAEYIDSLKAYAFDLAINVASMQEMNSKTIKQYFEFLRNCLKKNNHFYCCNRKKKVMPGGEVSEFYDYPWSINDNHIVEGECPWHRFFFSLHTEKNGPKLTRLKNSFHQLF